MVRSYMEFMGGNVEGSINIPLQEIPQRIEEFKSEHPVVVCCASGNRSGQAAMYLKSMGIDNVVNGGSWLDVNFLKNN